MGTSSGYLLHSIIDLLVDDLLHILLKLKGNLDDIEDVVFDDKHAPLQKKLRYFAEKSPLSEGS